MSSGSKARATTMSVDEWARIDTTIVSATKWKISSAAGMPEASTSSP